MPDANNTQYPALEKMVFTLWKSQQRQRRWRLFKRIFWSIILVATGIYSWLELRSSVIAPIQTITTINKPHTVVIDLKGTITESFDLRYLGTDDIFISKLKKAFKNPNVASVVLRIDSSGGSVVPTQVIHREIKYYQKKYPTIPIIAICEAVCASGAYYIASACNEIYAHPASIIGSIGVRQAGASLGFANVLKKVGAERRVLTAGKYSNFLDPFLPASTEELQIQQSILKEIHTSFIKTVKAGRRERLKEIDKNADILFSGQVWTGRQALELGLVDGLHTFHSLTRDLLKTKIVIYDGPAEKPSVIVILRKLLPSLTR